MKTELFILSAALAAAASLANEVRTYDVPEGETSSVFETLPAGIDIVKTGLGKLIVSNDNNSAFNGTVTVSNGILEVQSSLTTQLKVFGTSAANTITVEPGAQLLARVPGPTAQAELRFPNNLVMGGGGPDGKGAFYFVKSGGGLGNVDNLFKNVTLTADTTFYSSTRCGFATGGTVNLAGHTLTYRTDSKSTDQFITSNTTYKDGNLVMTNGTQFVLQGATTYNNVTATFIDAFIDSWSAGPKGNNATVIFKGNSRVRIGAGTGSGNNVIPWPIRIDGTMQLSSYSGTANMRGTLSGLLSGTGKVTTVDPATWKPEYSKTFNFWLTNPNNSWTGGVAANCGTLWSTVPGSVPLACGPITSNGGTLNFVTGSGNWDIPSVHTVLTNWNGSGTVNLWTDAGKTLTDDLDFVQMSAYSHAGDGTINFSADTPLDGKSSIRNAGGTLNVTSKDGKKFRRLSELSCYAGTLTLEDAGYIWAGEWDVENNIRGATNKFWYVGNNTGNKGAANHTTPARMVVKSGTTLVGMEVPGQKQSSHFDIQDTGRKGAILEVCDGAVITNTLRVAYDSNTRGAYLQWGGDVHNSGTAGNDVYVGCNSGSYGYFLLAGGKYSVRDWLGFARVPSSSGVGEITGGEFKITGSSCVLSRGGWGELYMTGGSFLGTAGTDGQPSLRMGEIQWGDKNGSSKDRRAYHGTITLAHGNPYMKVNYYIDMCNRTNHVFTSVVNLNAGVIETPMFAKCSWLPDQRPDTRAYLNFGGGTHRFYNANVNIFGAGARACNRVTSFPGGATFDVNGKNGSNADVPIQKPSGKGIASISLPGAPRAGYLGAPEVFISGGGGAGATAHAIFDPRTGVVSGIEVTSPGWDYTSAPTVVIYSAERTNDVVCTATLTDGDEQPSGGITITNSSATAGVFTLTGANTYTGATVVAGGTLKLGAANVIPAANEVRCAGGTFDVAAFDVSYVRFGGYGAVSGTGSLTITGALAFDAADFTANDQLLSLTVPPTLGAGATIDILNTNLLNRAHGPYTLATCASALPILPESNLVKPWSVYLTDGGKTLKLHYAEGTVVIFR